MAAVLFCGAFKCVENVFLEQLLVLLCFLMNHMGAAYTRIRSRNTDKVTGPRSAVGNVSGNRCESACRSRGHEFLPGPVPYFHGD